MCNTLHSRTTITAHRWPKPPALAERPYLCQAMLPGGSHVAHHPDNPCFAAAPRVALGHARHWAGGGLGHADLRLFLVHHAAARARASARPRGAGQHAHPRSARAAAVRAARPVERATAPGAAQSNPTSI